MHSLRGLSGHWHSGLAINATDYRLEDCRYQRTGSFECMATDRGCASGFCEAESVRYSGTWSIDSVRLTRNISDGWAPHGTTAGEIQSLERGVLMLSGGQRWFRHERARNQHIVGAP